MKINKGITGMRIGFDNDKYLKIQSEHIKERISQFGDKLYLEFGGKLFDDYHASRVLPGFAPDSKLQMLMQLADVAEIVIVISAADIQKKQQKLLQRIHLRQPRRLLLKKKRQKNQNQMMNRQKQSSQIYLDVVKILLYRCCMMRGFQLEA